MLTAQQVDNNIVRVCSSNCSCCNGAVLNPYIQNSRDEALALPTEASVQVALRTQQIVAYESGLADVVDPLGGSYYVEAMTNAIYDEAMAYIKKIDEMGGACSSNRKRLHPKRNSRIRLQMANGS